jgi:hypothetical protein
MANVKCTRGHAVRTGLKIAGIGVAALCLDLLLEFVVFGEDGCSAIDVLLFRDVRGTVECSNRPFMQARVAGYLGVGMGLCGIVGSAILDLISGDDT